MARFEVEGVYEALDEIREYIDDLPRILDDMVTIAAEVFEEELKTSAEAAGHHDTGDMIRSIKRDQRITRKDDLRIVRIYARGTDKKGISNGQKTFTLNYGSSRIAGSGFADKAEKTGAPKAEEGMQYIWDLYHKEKGMTK